MTGRLTPFSYVILVLVGRGGAGPHDLRRMADEGPIWWDAAPSQWYAEPKRLAALGLLSARKEPGRTRDRTHYSLTIEGIRALEAWTRTPAGLPRMQHETVVRLMAASIVPAAAVREGLASVREEVTAARAAFAANRERWEGGRPANRAYLEVNDRYARRLLDLQLEWLDEAEQALGE